MIRAFRPLLLLHLICNVILLLLVYYWLGLGESRASALAWSAAVAIVLFVMVCWLHGAAFAYFLEPADGVRGALRRAMGRLLPFAVLLLVIAGIYRLVSSIWPGDVAGTTIASFLTLHLRKPVKPSTVTCTFTALGWVVGWMVLPVILLPAAAGVARRGWRGFREVGAGAGVRAYWLFTPLLLLAALWLPFKLFDWVPHVRSFGLQLMSLAVRLAIGYFCFVAAWLSLVFLTCAGSPRWTQSKTAPSP